MMSFDLRTMRWRGQWLRTEPLLIEGRDMSVDVWALAVPTDSSQPGIMLTVPEGRRDIVEFMIRALWSAQNVLIQLRPGEELSTHLYCPFPERAH